MIIAIIVAIAICGIAFYFMEFHQAVYYTKIDNTRVEKISANDDMKYQYTLDCYNENGKIKELKFKTSRELRENAYLIRKKSYLDRAVENRRSGAISSKYFRPRSYFTSKL